MELTIKIELEKIKPAKVPLRKLRESGYSIEEAYEFIENGTRKK